MFYFIALIAVSFVGLAILFLRHVSHVRKLSEEHIYSLIRDKPSPFHEVKHFLIPFGIWMKQRISFLFLRISEKGVKRLQWLLLYCEKKLRFIADYLHGRKAFLRHKGQSPFWESMHEWKNELKNGNSKQGEKKE